MNAIQEALLNPDIKDPLKLPRTILQGFSDTYKKVKGTSTGDTFTGALRKPEGYTTYPKNVVLEGNSDAVTTGKELGVVAPGAPKLIGTPITTSPTKDTTTNAAEETTTGQVATTPTDAATNSQADALSNNVNEGENKAKQTMTVQSGSDMGGVNYTNAGGKSTTATTSSDDVMPQESATPTNQKYNSWIQNASTFGTSDEREKQPLTLTKTVYWKSRRKK